MNASNSIVFSLAVAGLISMPLSAQVITVTTQNDESDIVGGTFGELPGPDGRVSLREAVAVANNTPGPQTIAFNIPLSEYSPGEVFAELRNEASAFALTDDGTLVDFTTQTAFAGDTNPNGYEVAIFGAHPSFMGIAAIAIYGDNCTVKGLDRVLQRGYGVDISGHNNRVIGCHIYGPLYAGVRIAGGLPNEPATGNIVGGTAPGEGNSLSSGNSGVRITGPAENNIVIGNFLTGSSAGVEIISATCCPGYVASNNRIGGPTPAERNIISGAGHYGEEGFPGGTQVSLEWAVNTIVEGNYIGTTADGNAPFAPQIGPGGVSMVNSPGSIVRNNLISGLAVNGFDHASGQRFGIGVGFAGNCAGSIVQGNLIGTNAAGTGPVPNYSGVAANFWPATQSSGGVLVGGTLPGQANTIAFNETVGVWVNATITRVHVSGNSIHSNTGLGIELVTFGPIGSAVGPTPNDLGDGDNGGNGLQNYPVLTAADAFGSSIAIEGTFNSTAKTGFTLEFFSSPACDPTGFGEGRTFLGSTDVMTNAAGNASFSVNFPVAVAADSVVTATATVTATGNTSEFSACLPVDVAQMLGDLNSDNHVNGVDLGILLVQWGTLGTADLNSDGDVNGVDLGILLNSWTF